MTKPISNISLSSWQQKKKQLPILAVVMPCYNEEDVLPSSIERIRALLAELVDNKIISDGSFLCLVDDGSIDRTWEILEIHATTEPDIFKVIKLTRNYGHQNAILAGMEAIREHCDCCVTIDVDLQDDERKIRDMVLKYCENDTEIVLGIRNKREVDSFFKKYTAKAFYKLMNLLGCQIIEDHADYRLLGRRALSSLAQYKEYNLFLRGIMLQMGFKTDFVYYDRKSRTAGVTKYTLSKMLNLAVSGITSFSIFPLRVIFVTGFVFFLISILFSLRFLYVYYTGQTVQGWTTLVISIWTLSGVNLMSLGVVGEYVGRIFLECKERPRYHVELHNIRNNNINEIKTITQFAVFEKDIA